MIGAKSLYFLKLLIYFSLLSIISCSQEKYEKENPDAFVIIKKATFWSESTTSESIN